MERVTGTTSTHHQFTQQRPDVEPAGKTDESVSRPALRPPEEMTPTALNPPAREADGETTEQVGSAELTALVQDMNDELHSLTRGERDIALVWDDDIEEMVVQVKERESGEVITQWPPEEIVAMRVAFRQMIGMMVDQKS